MNDYEMMYIVHPDADEEAVSAINETVGEWISAQGGEVTNTNVWGRRKLAYAIRKQSEGSYVVVDMRMSGANLLDLEHSLKLSEQILRYMIIRKND